MFLRYVRMILRFCDNDCEVRLWKWGMFRQTEQNFRSL